MKGKELEIGSRVWEDFGGSSEPYSAGRVVAMSDSVERSDVVYVLLRSDDGKFTMYSMDKNYNCNPRLTREIPPENFVDLVRVGLSGVDLPEESDIRPTRKKPAKEDPMPAMEIPDGPVVQSAVEPAVDPEGLQHVDESSFVKDDNSNSTIVIVGDEEIEFERIFMGFDVTMKVV